MSYGTKSIAEEAAIITKLMLDIDVLKNHWEINVWENLGWHASIVLKDAESNHLVSIYINPPNENMNQSTYYAMVGGNKHLGNAQWSSRGVFFNPKDALKHEMDSFELFCKRVEDYRNEIIIKLIS